MPHQERARCPPTRPKSHTPIGRAGRPDRVALVMMAFRIPRAEVILQKLLLAQPTLDAAAAGMVFTPAEQYVSRPQDYERMASSAAYRRTIENERIGIRKMLVGQSGTTGGKT